MPPPLATHRRDLVLGPVCLLLLGLAIVSGSPPAGAQRVAGPTSEKLRLARHAGQVMTHFGTIALSLAP